MRKAFALGALVCSALLSQAASATTLSVDSYGWINSSGTGNGVSAGNSFTGNEFSERFNSWISFDLSGVSGSFSSAVLNITPDNYPSNDSVVYNVSLYDVVYVSYSQLENKTAGILGYLDLGAGGLYGNANFTSHSSISINLSAQALADINAKVGGRFIIGFTNNTLNAQVATSSVDLGVYTNNAQLVLSPVPEPAAMGLLISGLAVAGVAARRASRKAHA